MKKKRLKSIGKDNLIKSNPSGEKHPIIEMISVHSQRTTTCCTPVNNKTDLQIERNGGGQQFAKEQRMKSKLFQIEIVHVKEYQLPIDARARA